MTILADLLDDPALRLLPIVEERRDDPVRWVATSELEDPAPFLEGGEVLLTTGLDTVGWSQEWDGYVLRLAGAGVVAIGLAVGLTYPAAPAELVDACRRHRVDLFEVPRDIRFVAISQALAAQVQRQEASAARAALEAQRLLTQAALRDGEPLVLLGALAEVGAMAAVVGRNGVPALGPLGARPELFEAGAVEDAVAKMRREGLRAAASLTSPGGTVLVHPLGVKGRPDRYLVVGFVGRVGDTQRSTVATAVALLSLAEERRRAGREAERRLRTRAVELLVAGDERTAMVLLTTGSGPRVRLPRQVAVLRVAGPPAGLEDALGRSEAAAAFAAIVTAEGEPELVVVLSAAADVAGTARGLADDGLRVGIGEPSASVAASHETAGHGLRLTTAEAPVVSWSEGVRRGVLSLLDRARAQAFARSYLAPFEDDPELVETLESYLRHHGSLLKAADDLGVHRNTVRHRVDRIEGLLDRSLLDPQVRVDAWVALRAQENQS